MMKLCLVLILFTGVVTCHTDPEIPLYYEDYVAHLINPRNPTVGEGKAWVDAREYIKEIFFRDSLTIKVHHYNTTVASLQDEEIMVWGENIIGIAEGHNTSNDKVILVGADYDTRQSPVSAVANNGVGVAALLEIARVYNTLIRSPDFASNYTVIFVAFDLNTREHYPSKGTPGAEAFVRDWLLNYLKNDTSRFRGAIILDEISNYNMDDNSQTLFPGSSKYMPDADSRIKETIMKGNFLSMIQHWTSMDDEFAANFSGMYNKKRIMLPYRLQEMKILKPQTNDPTFGALENVLSKTSQYPFWDKNLPAILLTDTGDYRQDPCTGRCRPSDFVSGDRKKFIDTTCTAVIDTLLKLQTTHLMIDPPPNGSSKTTVYLLQSLLMAVMAYVLN